MNEVSTIGLDLAKNVFQVHGADAPGRVVICKQPRRSQVLAFFSLQPRCVVAVRPVRDFISRLGRSGNLAMRRG